MINLRQMLLIAVAYIFYGVPAYAGPYAGITLSTDNDRGFCKKNDFDDYCESAKVFAGYDGKFENDVGWDANISYEDQLGGKEYLNPTRGSITIYKRW